MEVLRGRGWQGSRDHRAAEGRLRPGVSGGRAGGGNECSPAVAAPNTALDDSRAGGVRGCDSSRGLVAPALRKRARPNRGSTVGKPEPESSLPLKVNEEVWERTAIPSKSLGAAAGATIPAFRPT